MSTMNRDAAAAVRAPSPAPAADRGPSRWALAALALAPLIAGGLVGAATNARGLRWYRRLAKPSWTPPDAVFGPVWTVLYILMGIALVLVVRERRRPDALASGRLDSEADRTAAPATAPTPARAAAVVEPAGPSARPRLAIPVGAFATQLALNLLWSIVFFGARRVRLAFAELVVLWVAIATTIVAFWRVRPVAGVLLVPYLAWTTFAGALNLAVARRNRAI